VTSLEAAQTIILTSAMKCILLSFLIAENARGFLSKKMQGDLLSTIQYVLTCIM
jgi:hypothetical protein